MGQKSISAPECVECRATYLRIPPDVISNDQIFCSKCCGYIGRWHEIEQWFKGQGSVFRLQSGHIVPIDRNDEINGFLRAQEL
ncbi:hypothetical protein QFZ34_000378 [Phyllobacterium ifriqiyense]|uniref:Uncharacterized protein n=1 Tax=Phyllobacterium ifriqiyense TaxID=314238 RepID=A0ABU0S3K1_9HYPH|nr:hypothetical protein [Phyllobacterium ifriqiyense]